MSDNNNGIQREFVDNVTNKNKEITNIKIDLKKPPNRDVICEKVSLPMHGKITVISSVDDITLDSILNRLDTLKSINIYGQVLYHYITQVLLIDILVLNDQQVLDDEYSENSLTVCRGYTRCLQSDMDGYKIVLYASKYETHDSIHWVAIHELVHAVLLSAPPYIKALFRIVCQSHYKNNGIYKSTSDIYYKEPGWIKEYIKDDIHDSDPEEIWCNLVATYVIGQDMSRHWWRKNIEVVDAMDKQ